MLKWSHMKQPEQRDCSCGCHMPQEPLKLFQWYHITASEGTQAVQHYLGTLVKRGVPSYSPSNSTPRKEIICTGETLLFSQLTRSPHWHEVPKHQVPVIAQRHNRRTGGGAAKGSRVGWYRRRCVPRHPHRTPWVPNGTGQRCVGRYIIPEPYSLGCWQKWVVGESEEAGRRTLSSHGPENPEEKEIALGPAVEQNKTKHRILLWEQLRYAKSTSQFHWRFLLKSEMIGASR